MRQLKVTFAGVDITDAGTEYVKSHPFNRVNFFDVPWNASNPGYGKVLVTSKQLDDIEKAVANTNGRGTLSLGFTEDEEPKINMPAIYIVKATPIYGHTFQNSKEDTVLSTTQGLYELELQDQRAVQSMCVLDTSPTSLSIYNKKDVNDEYDDTTINGEVPWMFREIIGKITTKIAASIPSLPMGSMILPGEEGLFTQIFDNLYLVGLPCLLAADLLIAALNRSKVIKFNPLTGEYRIVGLGQSDISDTFIDKLEFRLSGGRTRLYASTSIPQSYIRYKGRGDTPEEVEIDSYASGQTYQVTPGLELPVPGTVVPMWLKGETTATIILPENPRLQPISHTIYRDFHPDLLDVNLPFSLISFDWSSIPVTTVHLTATKPIRAIVDGPFGWWLKDVPLRFNIGNNIFLSEVSEGGGKATRFKIVSVEDDFYYCLKWTNGSFSGDNVKVAKPWEIRRNPWFGNSIGGFTVTNWLNNGESRNHTRDSDGHIETQYIIPPFWPDNEIWATRSDSTGVTDCDWIDINMGARAWGKVTEAQE